MWPEAALGPVHCALALLSCTDPGKGDGRLSCQIRQTCSRSARTATHKGGLSNTHSLLLGQEIVQECQEDSPGQRAREALQDSKHCAEVAGQQLQLGQRDLLLIAESLDRIQILQRRRTRSQQES